MTNPGRPDHSVREDWITTREAAEVIGVTANQVRYLAREEILETRKFGHAWMINRASAEAYATSDRRPGPKPRESSASD